MRNEQLNEAFSPLAKLAMLQREIRRSRAASEAEETNAKHTNAEK